MFHAAVSVRLIFKIPTFNAGIIIILIKFSILYSFVHVLNRMVLISDCSKDRSFLFRIRAHRVHLLTLILVFLDR